MTQRRSALFLAASFVSGLLLLPAPALACRLALALGFDVSRSVDESDYRLQQDGIVAALFDPEIRALILNSAEPVMLSLFEWAGQRQQTLIVGWTRLDSPAAIDQVALQVLAHRRQITGLTAVGSALLYGRDLLQRQPDCLWHTLDLAGDGKVNDGPEPRRIYDTTDFGGIVVNALVVGEHESDVLRWFEQNVLHGPGAFAEFAATQDHFGETFRRKLIRELSDSLLSAAQPAADDPVTLGYP
ncbi:MAG: DUF1194 domain-containing protein [Rhodobacteraceae bacterium]|jgi:hypothetical protein|nr:DUF1194 domain-containing protein [Paracoccaceae bacterium]